MATWLRTAGKFGLGFSAAAIGGTFVYAAATGGWGSILVLIALVIALVKQLIAFVGFLTFVIKILVVLAFAALILGVGLMIFRTWSNNKKKKE